MSTEQEQLEAAISGLESQRALLGDVLVDTALAPMRAKLAALAALTPLEPPAQTLKHVTILFLDIVGSTSLSQHLDPEEIHAVMDGALARFAAVVESHGGKVLKYAGDSVLAVFGADETREDDAERAVRSGLALLEEGRHQGELIKRERGHAGFNVRVGLHTGGVLLGGGVDAQSSIRGMAVNVAARMEQTAPAGGLRISHDTYTQVRGMFDVEPQEPLSVKGVDEPVQSYLVRRAKPRSFRIATRGIEGVATRMIGRDAELEALQEAFKRLFDERKLAAVTVVADAGIGKSRLLSEFEAWSQARPESFYIFRGRATPQTQRQPFGLLRDILTWRLQIADDNTIEDARAKIEQSIVPLFLHDDGADLAEGHAHLLGHLIGIDYHDSRHLRGILDDPKQIRNRAFHAAAQMFRRVSASDDSPIVLQLEDLHWADDGSLDFLNYLCEVDRDVPILILSFARPTLFERRTDWKSTEGIHQRIDLGPLDPRASRDLALELLKKLPEIPAALRELVTGGAEGNPFYMEELVKMLIDQGAIITGSHRWTLHPAKLLATHVPPTLTGVLQARLDGLPAPEKLTLQEASVIGAVFWDQALIALDERATVTLPALVQRELALPRADAAIDGLREYVFKHQILHQVTYNTVLKRIRRELHGKLARWLAGLTGLRADDFLGVIAEHYDRAGEATQAAEYHARAAEHAKTRFAHDAVLPHVQRALDLLEKLPPGQDIHALRWRLLEARERTLELQGRRTEQRADIDALERVADVLNDDRRRAHAAWRRSILSQRTADFPAQEAAARRAMALAESADATPLRLLSMRLVASALASQGDLEAGKAMAQRCLLEARALGLRLVEAFCLNTLAGISARQDDPVAVLELNQQSLAVSREIGDQRNEAIGLVNVGLGRTSLGELAQARRDLEEGLRLARVNGDRAMECVPLCNLSQLALWQGDDARALGLAHSALDIAVAVEARESQMVALVYLGHAELALGRLAAAAQAYRRGRTVALELDHSMQHDATAGLARVALAQGDGRSALQEVEGLLAHLASGATLDGAEAPRLVEMTCHTVLARAGDARAGEWLERAHRKLQATAATITSTTLRPGFLTNIPEHREIVAAWAAHQAASGEGM